MSRPGLVLDGTCSFRGKVKKFQGRNLCRLDGTMTKFGRNVGLHERRELVRRRHRARRRRENSYDKLNYVEKKNLVHEMIPIAPSVTIPKSFVVSSAPPQLPVIPKPVIVSPTPPPPPKTNNILTTIQNAFSGKKNYEKEKKDINKKANEKIVDINKKANKKIVDIEKNYKNKIELLKKAKEKERLKALDALKKLKSLEDQAIRKGVNENIQKEYVLLKKKYDESLKKNENISSMAKLLEANKEKLQKDVDLKKKKLTAIQKEKSNLELQLNRCKKRIEKSKKILTQYESRLTDEEIKNINLPEPQLVSALSPSTAPVSSSTVFIPTPPSQEKVKMAAEQLPQDDSELTEKKVVVKGLDGKEIEGFVDSDEDSDNDEEEAVGDQLVRLLLVDDESNEEKNLLKDRFDSIDENFSVKKSREMCPYRKDHYLCPSLTENSNSCIILKGRVLKKKLKNACNNFDNSGENYQGRVLYDTQGNLRLDQRVQQNEDEKGNVGDSQEDEESDGDLQNDEYQKKKDEERFKKAIRRGKINRFKKAIRRGKIRRSARIAEIQQKKKNQSKRKTSKRRRSRSKRKPSKRRRSRRKRKPSKRRRSRSKRKPSKRRRSRSKRKPSKRRRSRSNRKPSKRRRSRSKRKPSKRRRSRSKRKPSKRRK